jgi:hypothetical protein
MMSRTKEELDYQIDALMEKSELRRDVFFAYGNYFGYDNIKDVEMCYVGEYDSKREYALMMMEEFVDSREWYFHYFDIDRLTEDLFAEDRVALDSNIDTIYVFHRG